MKRIGAYFEYEEERNRDLMRAYREQLTQSKEVVSLPDVYRQVVDMPSKRFWVSEERATIVIGNIMKGHKLEKMRPTKREMFFEIYSRVCELKKKRPNDSIYDLVFDVVNQPAPKFYLTPGSAKVIIFKIKKQWYEERKRKYRHLYM